MAASRAELRIQERHVEPDVVPEHRQVANECRDLPGDLPEPRRGDQVAIRQSCELAHVIRYTSLRVDQGRVPLRATTIDVPGEPDLDHPMLAWPKASCLDIDGYERNDVADADIIDSGDGPCLGADLDEAVIRTEHGLDKRAPELRPGGRAEQELDEFGFRDFPVALGDEIERAIAKRVVSVRTLC